MTIGTMAPAATTSRRVGCLGSGLASASLAVMHHSRVGVTEYREMFPLPVHARFAHISAQVWARLKKGSVFRICLKMKSGSRFAQDHPFCAKKCSIPEGLVRGTIMPSQRI
jgi:hypothetical protein